MTKDAKGHGSNKRSGATFGIAKAVNDHLERAAKEAGAKLSNMSGGGPMGLTPDSVKQTDAWRRAHAGYNSAHAALRAHNLHFTKEYKKELAAHRDAERMSRVRATTKNEKY